MTYILCTWWFNGFYLLQVAEKVTDEKVVSQKTYKWSGWTMGLNAGAELHLLYMYMVSPSFFLIMPIIQKISFSTIQNGTQHFESEIFSSLSGITIFKFQLLIQKLWLSKPFSTMTPCSSCWKQVSDLTGLPFVTAPNKFEVIHELFMQYFTI